MLDIKYIREHAEEVKENCAARRIEVDVDELLRLDGERLELMRRVELLRQERNEIAEKMKAAKAGEREGLINQGKKVKENIVELEPKLKTAEESLHVLLLQVPNLTHPDTPRGETDADNREWKIVGNVIKPKFQPKSHVELAAQHDLMDFERGAKVAGAKFYFLKGKLAILEQALIRYGIDFAIREGFTFLMTPDFAKEEVMVGKGFLPRGPEKQVYYIEGEDLALIGSSEATVLGYHMNEVLRADELPKKYVALSHCFRREAGTYGRESYGLYRVHQFSKVEMFAFSAPDQSEAIHLEFLRLEELFWKSLEIPFRVVDCCTGDLGGSDYRRYDLEAWMWGKNEGQGGWGEVTSTSNCLDFQARGLNIRSSNKDFLHTLNGTVVATPRALLSILESHQQADGSIKIPKVLQKYCGFKKIG
ncbi:MAG: serine--tRNA ligase [Candidatus Uhrbacteria bacterium]|nr:serine--tRNA ligase [Candidatus Uhrbacteria bacterium]